MMSTNLPTTTGRATDWACARRQQRRSAQARRPGTWPATAQHVSRASLPFQDPLCRRSLALLCSTSLPSHFAPRRGRALRRRVQLLSVMMSLLSLIATPLTPPPSPDTLVLATPPALDPLHHRCRRRCRPRRHRLVPPIPLSSRPTHSRPCPSLFTNLASTASSRALTGAISREPDAVSAALTKVAPRPVPRHRKSQMLQRPLLCSAATISLSAARVPPSL